MDHLTSISDLINGLDHFRSQYILTGGILVLVLSGLANPPKNILPPLVFTLTLVVVLVSKDNALFSFPLYRSFHSASFFEYLAYISGILTCFLVENSSLAHIKRKNELYVLLMTSLLGMSLLAVSHNLLSIFLGLECITLPAYCLAAIGFNTKSIEASTKYVLFGSATAALMLFGMSLLYGITGSLDLNALILASGRLQHSPLMEVALLLLLVGLLFKIAAFPFHGWAPDVYEGTPTPIVAFFSIAPKALTFVALIKLVPFFDVGHLRPILVLVSIISMTFGNLLAMSQTNAKRLLAYSSVSHSGFLLMGVSSGIDFEFDNILYYLSIYLLMNFSAFHLLQVIARWKKTDDMDAFAGLGKSNPYLATSLLITMISLTGLPPAAGFSAKLFMFSGVYESYKANNDVGLFALLIVALINTVVSLFYYLKMPFYAFFRDNGEKPPLKLTIAEKAFILTLNALLLLFFFKPDWVFDFIHSIKLEG